MNPKIVFFDCAQTLIQVDWRLGDFMTDIAGQIGLHLAEGAGNRYLDLYRSRLAQYQADNMTKSRDVVRQFWLKLNADWLGLENQDVSIAESLVDAGDEKLFCAESEVFQPYNDVRPCLERLSEKGFALGIISNWDISLHRVLETFELTHYFQVVLASLEEGVEKPAKRLFQLALERTGFQAEEALHVGDDAWDDLQGARNAGMRAALIDRSRKTSVPPFLASLDRLELAFDWPLVRAEPI